MPFIEESKRKAFIGMNDLMFADNSINSLKFSRDLFSHGRAEAACELVNATIVDTCLKESQGSQEFQQFEEFF